MSAATICPKGKRPYATQAAAEEALRAINELKRKGVKGLSAQRAYECPWCLHWHLTHRPRRGDDA